MGEKYLLICTKIPGHYKALKIKAHCTIHLVDAASSLTVEVTDSREWHLFSTLSILNPEVSVYFGI